MFICSNERQRLRRLMEDAEVIAARGKRLTSARYFPSGLLSRRTIVQE